MLSTKVRQWGRQGLLAVEYVSMLGAVLVGTVWYLFVRSTLKLLDLGYAILDEGDDAEPGAEV